MQWKANKSQLLVFSLFLCIQRSQSSPLQHVDGVSQTTNVSQHTYTHTARASDRTQLSYDHWLAVNTLHLTFSLVFLSLLLVPILPSLSPRFTVLRDVLPRGSKSVHVTNFSTWLKHEVGPIFLQYGRTQNKHVELRACAVNDSVIHAPSIPVQDDHLAKYRW